MSPTKGKYLTEVALFIVSQVVFYYGIKYVLSSLDPSNEKKKRAKSQAEKLLDKYGKKDLELTDYEQIIATELVHADEISVSFKDIGGLDSIVQDLKETVIYPLKYSKLFSDKNPLLSPPKGVLLYGPPGCGKTMLAKCLAKESGATFINMRVSTLTDKWYGESNKLVSALFSLAHKMQPCIIFIDEIDSFLRERRSNDHEVTGTMKAEFMTLWDGLTSEENNRIIVLGATNRAFDIDQAILRRMPKRFNIAPPTEEQRLQILKLFLKDANLEENFDFRTLAQLTFGQTGSELKELCRETSMVPIRECMRQMDMDSVHRQKLIEESQVKDDESNNNELNSSVDEFPFQPRALRLTDFAETALRLATQQQSTYAMLPNSVIMDNNNNNNEDEQIPEPQD